MTYPPERYEIIGDPIPLLILGGEIGYVNDPDDFDIGALIMGRLDLVMKTPEVGIKVAFYVEDEDKVREFQLRGAVGMRKIREPTAEDRQTVSAYYAARMIAKHKLDMHDFKRIVEWALRGMDSVHPNWDQDDEELYNKLDNIHHELGGTE